MKKNINKSSKVYNEFDIDYEDKNKNSEELEYFHPIKKYSERFTEVNYNILQNNELEQNHKNKSNDNFNFDAVNLKNNDKAIEGSAHANCPLDNVIVQIKRNQKIIDNIHDNSFIDDMTNTQEIQDFNQYLKDCFIKIKGIVPAKEEIIKKNRVEFVLDKSKCK
jgi:hypothetical protein